MKFYLVNEFWQNAYKNRLKEREVRVLNELDQSERNFNEMFHLIRQERIETEEAYQKLLRTPAKSILMFDAIKEDKTRDVRLLETFYRFPALLAKIISWIILYGFL